MRRVISVVTVCLLIAAVFSGCGVLQKLGLMNNNDELRPASSITIGEDEAKKLSDKIPVRLYFANEDYTKLRVEIRYIPMTEAKKSPNALAGAIVNELINGPGKDSGLRATIPAETKLRSPIKIEAGTATVDLTKEFKDKLQGGKAEEQAAIFSIVNSLTEVKEIQKVRFTINGKKTEALKGNFQFDAPFPRAPQLISTDPAVPSAAPADDESIGTAGEAGENSEDTYIELGDEEEVLE